MTRQSLSLCVADISMFARSLRHQLDGLTTPPSHVEMLNLLTKAGGFRNFQHFRAQQQAKADLSVPRPSVEKVDYKRVKRLVRFFDADGRLVRWPKKFTMRVLCLWVLWSRIAPRAVFTERDISQWLDEQHLFGDYALLRRELVDRGLMKRTADGRQYRRVEQQPPQEAVELFRVLPQ